MISLCVVRVTDVNAQWKKYAIASCEMTTDVAYQTVWQSGSGVVPDIDWTISCVPAVRSCVLHDNVEVGLNRRRQPGTLMKSSALTSTDFVMTNLQYDFILGVTEIWVMCARM
jgi:hypothetical protein